MEDLLNDNNFTSETIHYNYKKYFMLFYLITPIAELLLFVGLVSLGVPNVMLVATVIFFPVICSLVMYLLKKQNKQLPFSRLLIATAILYCLYYFPVVITLFLDESIPYGLEIIFVMAFVEYLLSIAVIAALYFKKPKK